MRRVLVFCLFLLVKFSATGQVPDSVSITISNGREAIPGATIALMQNNTLVKAYLTNKGGTVKVAVPGYGEYKLKISHSGYEVSEPGIILSKEGDNKFTYELKPLSKTLESVQVTTKKPFIQQAQGKVLINVDASVTNTGATVLEVLEKSPGVMVDRNGTVSLQGKNSVMILIDDKPVFLSGTELSNMLGSMSASQVETIELITNPSARYDASGNAGIINIKTKKLKTRGFNGAWTASVSHGRYPKANNNILLNYRTGKWNSFFNYSTNYNKYFTDIYAYRKYYDQQGNNTAILDQPTMFFGKIFNNSLRTGIDYYATEKTTLGISLTGVISDRSGGSNAKATWLNQQGGVDSAVSTQSKTANKFLNGIINLNARHKISASSDLGFDVDFLKYDIRNEQQFVNDLLVAGGYTQASVGDIPSDIEIISGKLDYTKRTKNGKAEAGWKSSHISTDNIADYQLFESGSWKPDYNKSNHFRYKENIHALYGTWEHKYNKWSMQGGLRYEFTQYNAHQLGNIQRGDSAFSRKYMGLFPSGYISYEADSNHTFSFTAGRRIDRPAFQKLNPFVIIINKYTVQRGNPFFLPQYTWNAELRHQYKQLLTTSFSFSRTTDYFSQLFPTDPDGILVYTDGNVGRAYNLGLTIALQYSPVNWWNANLQVMGNYKNLSGYNGIDVVTTVKQVNISMNNQFTINKYTAELSGFYTSRARNDIQELLYPTGQLSAGVSRPILKGKGTLKASVRDIFFTQAMEGFTTFDSATEYFILKRDSRVANLTFLYRFGKAYKAAKRSSGASADEMQRVGQ